MAPQAPAHLANACRPPLQVRIWEIPEGGLKRNMTEALLQLHGHSRRVGLVEWHPTTNNILFSAGYDYKVCGQAKRQRAGETGWAEGFSRACGDPLPGPQPT